MLLANIHRTTADALISNVNITIALEASTSIVLFSCFAVRIDPLITRYIAAVYLAASTSITVIRITIVFKTANCHDCLSSAPANSPSLPFNWRTTGNAKKGGEREGWCTQRAIRRGGTSRPDRWKFRLISRLEPNGRKARRSLGDTTNIPL